MTSDVAGRSAEYYEDRDALQELFPRGRFRSDEDGSCILVARRKARRHDKGFLVAKGKTFGVYFLGRGSVYLNAAQDLLVRDLRGDMDGILHFRWDASLADRFPWFNRMTVKPGLEANLKAATVPLNAIFSTKAASGGPDGYQEP